MNSTIHTPVSKNVPGTPAPKRHLTPLAHILETPDGFTLDVELPGVAREGLEINVNQGELTIVGRRTAPSHQGKELYRESRGWDYRRIFELDSSIDAARISAKHEQGVLRLELPKAESMKPRQITISA